MDTWFAKGLRFKCTGCGKCCTGSPGYVWISDEESKKIATFLRIPLEVFYKTYTRIVHNRRALLEDRSNYDCIFLKGKRCQIYEHRPSQCRTYPWWPELLKSRKAWEEEADRCEGIDHPDAPLIPATEITNL